MAQALAVILTESGYDALPAYSGADALASCRLKWPDVVIVGVLFEPMNSVQLAAGIAAEHPGCRVLRISEDEMPSTESREAKPINSGPPVFSKPINSRAILEYLRNIRPTIEKGATLHRL